MNASHSVRLSRQMVPLHYAIRMKPDLRTFAFEGEETIRLRLRQATKTITLHAKELDIETAEVVRRGTKQFALKIEYDARTETATFTFAESVRPGTIDLRLVFRGVLNDKMRGFYRSRYEAGGQTRYLATTQFEATDARRAFPCFDEPERKAVFEVTLVVPKGLTAISNTVHAEIAEHAGGYEAIRFTPTPRMSTYLLAFIVGEFEHVQKKTKEGVLVRVFVTPGKKHQAAFALDCAVKTMSFFTTYFKIPYPLPVLDLIAIPDFAAGAMENWGAITYRETALLVDPEHSSADNKQWVALVIGHEIAHQWFGNLVTMEWWTHLWLNEGFASYAEYLAVDNLFPEWNYWSQFATDDFGIALRLDALQNTHPIEVDVHHPDEINEIFDAVSYSKGASIIRMLATYLGEKNFRQGLRRYFQTHGYKNASTVHLWRAFESVSGKPVLKLMRDWTRRPGYPLLKVTARGRELTVSQSRFYASRLSARRARREAPWKIPFRVQHGSGRSVSALLTGRTGAVSAENSWAKLNAGETAFARVMYSPELLARLAAPVRAKSLPALDRLGLVRDAFALAEAGMLPTAEALALAGWYVEETDYTVWRELATGLEQIRLLSAGTPLEEGVRSFIRQIFRGAVRRVGWQRKSGESHAAILLRSLLLLEYGLAGDDTTLRKARRQFNRIGRRNPVHADLRSVVYGLAAAAGGQAEHAKLIRMYRASSLHQEKERVGTALGRFRQKNLLARTLRFAFGKDVRSQDSVRIVIAVWMNPAGRELAWSFVRRNWKMILNRYGETHLIPRLLAPAGFFTDAKKAREIQAFFRAHPAPGARRAIEQITEKIRSNAAWLAQEHRALAEFLGSI